jgi:glycosyltransferase involved in cell wall biosynthesis
VIHHGIDVDRIPVGKGDGGYLVFLGRVSPSKGICEAIDLANRTGLPLRIAAKAREPEERRYFEARVRPELGGNIEWLGEVGGRDKYELLGGAIALVNPIQWAEPFGLVMIEALAAGTPVVSLARGAAPEIVDHGCTGYLGSSLSELVAGIEAIGRIDRVACRRAAETRFSSARMVGEHLDLFRSLLEGPPGCGYSPSTTMAIPSGRSRISMPEALARSDSLARPTGSSLS